MSVFPAWVDVLPTLSNGFKWMPGIPGGIPAGTLDTTLTAGQMTTSGIQTALNAASGRGSPTNIRVVQMPAGTYSGLGYITPQNYTILRGAGAWGAGRTRLNFNAGSNAGGFASITPAWPATANISGSLAIGATQVTVSSASTFAVGDIVQIDQLDDLSYVSILDAVYNKRTPWWSNHGPVSSGGLRSVTSIHIITAISGTNITFDPPTRIAYEAAFSPQMWRVSRRGTNGIWYSGLEDFSMAGPHDDNGAIIFSEGAYCWVKGVETDGDQSVGPGIINDHIQFNHHFRGEIRSCYCHHTGNDPNTGQSYLMQSGGAAYGININKSSSECLVIDSIAMWFCKAIQSNCCGPGNVVAYCYADNTSANGGDWMDGAISASHQSYSHNMLFEGCYGSNLACDATHGNSGRILFFRSYGHGQARDITNGGFLRAANVDGWSRETAFIGCVLNGAGTPAYEVNGCTDINAFVNSGPTIFRVGQCVWGEGDWNEIQSSNGGSGISTHPPTNNPPQNGDGRTPTFTSRCQELLYRHGNWDKVQNGQRWDAANSDHVIPASAFLSVKPSFFGTTAWPPVDPSTGLAGVTVPAQLRIVAGTPFDAAAPGPVALASTSTLTLTTSATLQVAGGSVSLAGTSAIALTTSANVRTWVLLTTDIVACFATTSAAVSISYAQQILSATVPIPAGVHTVRIWQVTGTGGTLAPEVVTSATLTPITSGAACTLSTSATVNIIPALPLAGTTVCALTTSASVVAVYPLYLSAFSTCLLGTTSTLYIPLPPVLVPGVLTAANASGGVFSLQGQNIVLNSGGWVEWTVDAGSGGSFDFKSLVSSLTGAVVRVSSDGVQKGTWNIPGQ